MGARRSTDNAPARAAADPTAGPTPIPILLYHGIAGDTDGPLAPWVVSPRVFAEHLEAIAETGRRPVTVRELARYLADGRPVPQDVIVLTFDDGFADFAHGALPALAARDWPATLYVTTGTIGGSADWLSQARRPMLDWAGVAEVAAAGIEIGAHTVHHPQLDVISPAAARSEIERSRAELEDRLGAAVDTFAYPHGYHDRRVRQLVVDAGFTAACAVGHGLSSAADDRFALRRVMVRHGDDPSTVARWIDGEGLPVATGEPTRLRSVAWRRVRRAKARLGSAA